MDSIGRTPRKVNPCLDSRNVSRALCLLGIQQQKPVSDLRMWDPLAVVQAVEGIPGRALVAIN